MIRSTAADVAAEYGPEYQREKEEQASSDRNLGRTGCSRLPRLLVPPEYAGAGMGILALGEVMETLCPRLWHHGHAVSGAHAGHGCCRYHENGTEAQKQTYLPDIANGKRDFSSVSQSLTPDRTRGMSRRTP